MNNGGYVIILSISVALPLIDTLHVNREANRQINVLEAHEVTQTSTVTSRSAEKGEVSKTEQNNFHSSNQDVAEDYPNASCSLEVLNYSAVFFSRVILKRKYNFAYLKLNFIGVDVNETKYVINKQDWVWTYKGEDGAHQYLFLPGDFGYLSFGLLWSHTQTKKIRVDIRKRGNCSRLTVGEKATNKLIGKALGTMTSRIAKHNDLYNSSYWCYNRRVWLYSSTLYHLCKNYVCTYQTFGYQCCRFVINFISRKRKVVCESETNLFGTLWWMFPIVLGHVGFAFYPIFLTKIGMKVNALSKEYKKQSRPYSKTHKRLSTFASQDAVLGYHRDVSETKKHHFVSLKDPNPITFTSTFLSPLLGLDISEPFLSRVLRVWIIFLPMTLSVIRVCLDYKYAREIVRTAISKGALVGFSSIIAGPDAAREQFLKILGGPVVALSIYIVFGCTVISVPANIESFLEKGLPNGSNNYLFLAQMPLQQKERFSGIQLRHLRGFKKIHNIFFAHTFLLLHWRFWKYAFKLFYLRWKTLLFQTIAAKLSTCVAVMSSVVFLPAYGIFCLSELILVTLYFLFPVMSCFFIVIKALGVAYFYVFQHSGCFGKLIRNLFLLPLLLLFLISWYMYCIIFFDGCWFLSKLAMFTYSGIFAYPKLSYGYMILAFMALYYLSESFSAFGENYRELLKLSLETCEKYQSNYLEDSDFESTETLILLTRRGIPSDLFYLIVDRTMPRRNQVMTTILKFAFVVTILAISVDLIITFNKFQDLSLVSHVFSVLFICAMPKIIRMICAPRNYRRKKRKILRQKIKKTITIYVRSKRKRFRQDEDFGYQTLSRDGYDPLNPEDSDSVNA